MRLKSIALRGLTRFTSAVPTVIDFDALGPGLIALTGDNGEGKTTIMEAPAAALYKRLPSRDTWYEYFHGRDAFVEAAFEDAGHEVKVRVQVDAERDKTERYLFLDGASTTTGRGKEADAEVLRRFGSYELFCASILGAQQRTGNFLDAVKGERKARFAELLGLGRLQALAEKARERRQRAELALDAARGELARLEVQAAGLVGAETDLEEAQARQEKAAGALETARQEETVATAALERARTAEERLRALRAAARAADEAVASAEREVRAAQESAAAATRTADQRRADHKEAEARRERLKAVADELPALKAARDAIPALVEEQARLEAAAVTLANCQTEKGLAETLLRAADRRRKDALAQLEREKRDLERRAGLMGEVPCTTREAWPRPGDEEINLGAACPLLADARLATKRAGTLLIDPELDVTLADAETRFKAAVAAIEAAIFDTDPLRLNEVKAEVLQLRAKAAREPDAERARKDLKAATADDKGVAAAIESDLIAALDVAEDKGRQATARLTAAVKAQEAASRAVGQEALESIPGAEVALSAARQARIDAERALREADKAVAAAEAFAAGIRALAEQLPAKQADLHRAEEAVGDWTILEKGLGQNGIQAMEIAAAGPEVARLVNELLAACYGTRWSIAFDTLREKKSSPGEFSEAFDIRVFDHGQERRVEGISGGERVIVGEAVALALAIYNARKSGIAWKTVFRDETSGALSLANAGAYVDMLRRARELGGFHQVIFISHQPEVVARADVRLIVAGGQVQVDGAAPMRGSSVVERLVHTQVVAGSSPAPASISR